MPLASCSCPKFSDLNAVANLFNILNYEKLFIEKLVFPKFSRLLKEFLDMLLPVSVTKGIYSSRDKISHNNSLWLQPMLDFEVIILFMSPVVYVSMTHDERSRGQKLVQPRFVS